MTRTNSGLTITSISVGGGGGGGSYKRDINEGSGGKWTRGDYRGYGGGGSHTICGGDVTLVSTEVSPEQTGTEAVVIRYDGPPKFIGGTIKYENDVTVHVFTGSGSLEPIRKSTVATRWACKTLAVMEAWGCVPKLPKIQNWWSAHKASDAARGIQSGGGGC